MWIIYRLIFVDDIHEKKHCNGHYTMVQASESLSNDFAVFIIMIYIYIYIFIYVIIYIYIQYDMYI